MSISLRFFNVGQGDSILIELPDGSYGMVDCHFDPLLGQAKPPALEFLEQRSDVCLRFICITHFDYDHFRGITQVLQHVADARWSIDEMWLPAVLDLKEIGEVFEKDKSDLIGLTTEERSAWTIPTGAVEYAVDRAGEWKELVGRVLYNCYAQSGRRVPSMLEPFGAPRFRPVFISARCPLYVFPLPDMSQAKGNDLPHLQISAISPVVPPWFFPPALVKQIRARNAPFGEAPFARNPYLPEAEVVAERNPASLVLQLVLGQTAIILTGDDADQRMWRAAMDHAENPYGAVKTPKGYHLVKAPHHGAAANKAFWSRVLLDGSNVVISASNEGNNYNHPSPETLSLLWRKHRLNPVHLWCTNTSSWCREAISAGAVQSRGLTQPRPMAPDLLDCLETFTGVAEDPTPNNCCRSHLFRCYPDGSVRHEPAKAQAPVQTCPLMAQDEEEFSRSRLAQVARARANGR